MKCFLKWVLKVKYEYVSKMGTKSKIWICFSDRNLQTGTVNKI